MTILVDVYPINFNEENYPISAYTIDASNADKIGGTFASKVRSATNSPAVWVKSEKVIVVPSDTSSDQLNSVLKELWANKQDGFEHVNGIQSIENWVSTPDALAQFVAIGILGRSFSELKETLDKHKKRTNIVVSQRKADFKGIVVDNKPALQITVRTSMRSYEKLVNLDIYDPDNPNRVLDLGARCGDTKGVITKIVGSLGEQREKFKRWKPTSYDPKILDELPDNHPIVNLKTYANQDYNYPLGVLSLHLDMGNLNSIGLSKGEIKSITRWLKISPDNRKSLIDSVAKAVESYLSTNFTQIRIGQRFSSIDNPNNFLHLDLLDKRLRFGTGTALVNRDSQMLTTIKKQGIYKYSNGFEMDKSIKIAVIDTIPHQSHLEMRNEQLKRFITHLGKFDLKVVRADAPINIYEQNIVDQKTKLQSGLYKLIGSQPNIILIYLPETDKYRSDSDEQSLYNTAKRICIGNGVPSQVIYEDTLSKSWTDKNGIIHYSADDNLILGILGKTGNIPYVLAKPIQFADVIVGLDVSRQVKKNAPGTMSFAALSRIYTNDGALIGYRTSSNASIPGEIIPQNVLEAILPPDEFSDKRVIVHRDGKFVGDELNDIMQWGEVIGAKFLPIEITKSGVARMYNDQNNQILQIPQGSVFKLSEKEAYLASIPLPGKKAFSTSQPIRIANFSSLSMDDALYSVTALTLLHYGSTRATRLPVSIHASDKIAGFLRRNITPQSLHGDVPFWL